MLYELIDVKLRYGSRLALSIPSLSISAGERVALLGPNGSGKTSLLKLMDGLIAPSEGTILREGQVASKMSMARPRSIYLHQYPYLLCGTVGYNITFGCRALGLNQREAERRSRAATAALALEGMEDRPHRSLSGGEAQRVALARALAIGADILLLDEPSASADAASVDLIASALHRSCAAGATVIFSSHDEDFVQRLSPRVLRLKGGRIEDEQGGTA